MNSKSVRASGLSSEIIQYGRWVVGDLCSSRSAASEERPAVGRNPKKTQRLHFSQTWIEVETGAIYDWRMTFKERIQALIALGNENRNLDYKGAFSWNQASSDQKCEIVKDVLAFANTLDGGLILIGVNDKSGALEGLTEEQSASFDQTKFNSFIQKYTDPRHTANVHRVEIKDKRLVAIDIPEFAEVPILCARDANSSFNSSKLILKKAALYKRTDRATSEVIEDAQEMRELLNRGLVRRQDELLRAFKQIIQPGGSSLSSEIGAEYNNEIHEAHKYFSESAGLAGNSTCWTVEMRPETYIPGRLQICESNSIHRAAIGDKSSWLDLPDCRRDRP